MADLALEKKPLPVGSIDRMASGWWPMVMTIATETALFAYLLFAYFYWAVQPDEMPFPEGGPPSLSLPAPDTVVLILSSVAVWWGERSIKRGDRRKATGGLAIGLVLGVLFVAVQGKEWRDKAFGLDTSAYGSLYFTITGFHLAHVAVGLLILLALTVWTAMGYFDGRRSAAVSTGALYWHFVDVVWLFIFATLYLTPYLGGHP